MAVILGRNSELWQTEWPQAVSAIQSLTKNIQWVEVDDPLGGTNFGGARLVWQGNTQEIRMPLSGATVDFYIVGEWPYGLAAAAALQKLWNGKTITNTFTWNGTTSIKGSTVGSPPVTITDNDNADQWCMLSFCRPWVSRGTSVWNRFAT